MNFVLVNLSTLTDAAYGGELTAAVLEQMAAAIEHWVNVDVGAEWGGADLVRASQGPGDLAPGDIPMWIVDQLPAGSDPQAVAYHDRNGQSLPFGYIARTMCNALLSGADAVSTAVAHEIGETKVDPACNLLADPGTGRAAWLEICDPPEADVYLIDGVSVPDFALKTYFAPGAAGPYDWLGRVGDPRLSSPFIPNATGYQGWQNLNPGAMKSPDAAVSLFGLVAPHKRAKKMHPSSRAYRRGLRLAA
jgi:hypothetical protein